MKLHYYQLYLKHMKGLKLNVARFFPQHVHHKFEIVWVADIATHGSKVVAVKQQLSKELWRNEEKCEKKEGVSEFSQNSEIIFYTNINQLLFIAVYDPTT